MNRKMRWALVLSLLPLAACSSSKPPMAAMTAPPPPMLASADQTFVSAASASDAGELQSSQVAQSKAHSARVKAFAAKMIKDHTASSQKLASIAQAKGATVSTTPSDMAQQMETKLDAAKPRMFDREYVHGQVTAHEAAVKTYETEIASGEDPDLKAFAQATLPVIKQHLMMAQKMAGRG